MCRYTVYLSMLVGFAHAHAQSAHKVPNLIQLLYMREQGKKVDPPELLAKTLQLAEYREMDVSEVGRTVACKYMQLPLDDDSNGRGANMIVAYLEARKRIEIKNLLPADDPDMLP